MEEPVRVFALNTHQALKQIKIFSILEKKGVHKVRVHK